MTLYKRHYGRLVTAAGFGACLAAAGCAGTASTGGETALERSGGEPADCILSRSVRDYTGLDERNLILYGPGSRAYHVVLATPSFNLDGEWSIGVLDGGGAGGDGRICPFGGDRIIVDGPLVEQLSIRSIESIDDAGVEALKVRFGQEEAASDSVVTVTDIEADDEAEDD